MPSSRSTIFFLAALAVVGPVTMAQPAHALQGMGPPPVRRAEHIEVAHKMIKRHSPMPRVVPIRRQVSSDPGGATQGPPVGVPPPNVGTSTSAITTTSSATRTVVPPTTAPTTTTAISTAKSTTIESSTISSTTTRSSTSSTPTSSSSTQQTSATSTPPTTTQDTATQARSTTSAGRSTVLVTATSVQSGAPQQSDKSKDEDASFLPKPAIVSLIVAASCVVAAAAIWTIIRKWKFGASRQFEDRLEPINWEPPATTGLPIDERDPAAVAIARGNSVTSHTRNSFGSSDNAGIGGRNMAAVGDQPVSVAPDFPPAHDFTAGPANLAPGAGYADLRRGPSPAPSTNYGGYGQQLDTPNPYDAYDYNGGYGGYGGVQQPPPNDGPGSRQF